MQKNWLKKLYISYCSNRYNNIQEQSAMRMLENFGKIYNIFFEKCKEQKYQSVYWYLISNRNHIQPKKFN